MIQNKKQGVKILSEFMGFNKPFHTSWDALMQVVEKLESLDFSEKMYSWEMGGETQYNFMGIEVDISLNRCWITINLQLDPPLWLNDEWLKKQNDITFECTKKEAVFFSCVEAVQYINEYFKEDDSNI